MRTPELEARRRAAAAISKMALVITRSSAATFSESAIMSVVPPLITAMVIRLNEAETGNPSTISELARQTGFSRQTVRRQCDDMIAKGILERRNEGVIASDEFLEQIDPAHFRSVIQAIREAATELADIEL
ncbi:MarR family transcriptional regulator [Bradyrhizobium zhanjiangense]|uniref:MarR family transcriptional regulator n=1 Tax=Bradyrhizobium zhanjiangense TaxID=1325107 RepID=A0ABY0DFU0_9BRAD|nr:helix-turn-helix domain-containing protein [Bradyrhizobium zhanjiangense]RXG91558.1 MarR family transcriptional regulator [Bradyrhizobium zhanjiangense]